jgi:hypothetical protein
MRSPVGVARCAVITALAGLAALPALAAAHAPSGAIFTTVADGSEVNFNHYAAKEDVYLDGGPGPGAPQHAAGLDDGTYVFQVTDPSGKVLLSTDAARCRQFTVEAGIITSIAPSDPACDHVTGVDVDHGALTVQLMPYLDTPNNGGVYKVWVTFLEDFLAGCEEFGVANGLDVVDCGQRGGNRHGFVPAHSKTDNFKVGEQPIVEIDTRFFTHTHDASSVLLDNRGVTWFDTHGAQNQKWSYWAPQLNVFHEAHVEAVETGTHKIQIDDQLGCQVAHVVYNGVETNGPTTVSVPIRSLRKDLTVFIDVYCD